MTLGPFTTLSNEYAIGEISIINTDPTPHLITLPIQSFVIVTPPLISYTDTNQFEVYMNGDNKQTTIYLSPWPLPKRDNDTDKRLSIQYPDYKMEKVASSVKMKLDNTKKVFKNSKLYECYVYNILNDNLNKLEKLPLLHVLVPLVGEITNGTQSNNSVIVFTKNKEESSIIQHGLVNLIKTNKLSCSFCAGPDSAHQVILQPILSISSNINSLSILKTRIHTFATDGCIINPETQERTQVYSDACIYPFLVGHEIPKFEGSIGILKPDKTSRYADMNLSNPIILSLRSRYPPNTRSSTFTQIYYKTQETQTYNPNKSKIKESKPWQL